LLNFYYFVHYTEKIFTDILIVG